MSLLREYIRGFLTEAEVKFSGTLKAMPSPEIIAQAEAIVATLPKQTTVQWSDDQPPVTLPVKPLRPDKFHVTLAHQSVLKPFKKQLQVMDKAKQLPPAPQIKLDPDWQERTDLGLQRRSYVARVVNQAEVGAYLNSVMKLVGGPMNVWETETPPREFHVSLANLTGSPGDSVR